MPASLATMPFSTRSEGIDLGEREAIGLDVQLARDGQERLAPEEVLREVDLTLLHWEISHIERGYAEQRSRSFRIRAGDDRRIHPQEAVLAEEAVDRLRHRVPHARRGGDDVRARAQVRHLAQELERVGLGLDRIVVGVFDPADDAHRGCLHLEGLPFRRRRHDAARRLHGAAGGKTHDLVRVVGQRIRRHHLHGMERRAVRQVDEGNPRLRVAPGAHPAAEGDRTVFRRTSGQDIAHREFIFHRLYSLRGKGSDIATWLSRKAYMPARCAARPTS